MLAVVTQTSGSAQSLRHSPNDHRDAPRFSRASTSSIVDHVVDQLREAIIKGEIPPQSRLIEQDLAEQFDVSRGPIRDALRKLEVLGLITLRPNRGAVVNALSAEDVLEVYLIRNALGIIAIRALIGSARVTEDTARLLTGLEQRARRKTTRSQQPLMVESDLAFQSGVIEACGLPRVIERFTETTDEVRRFVTTSGITYTDVDRIVDDHAILLKAILANDADRAVELWRNRMRTAVEEFLDLIPDGTRLASQRPWLWELL
jgi:DNA-binding GntR family transcriptional regulator